MFKKLLISLFIFFITSVTFAKDAWNNNLRQLFLSNAAVIYEINMRTFSAKDTDGNGIIDETETKGNFLNAITRLDNLVLMNINTLRLMPITPVGKIHAVGTAGSLYAPVDFASINPQIIDEKSDLSPKEQAKEFIKECHRRKLYVIVDLPAYGAYDLFLKNPELFKIDEAQKPIVPSDWNDVGYLESENSNSINQNVLNLYKSFIDMMIEINADGIVINSPETKSDRFWEELIFYTNKTNPDLVLFAETTDYEFLDLGFDSCYANLPKIKGWSQGNCLINLIKKSEKTIKKHNRQKSIVSDFSIHTEVTPVIINGADYSKMIIWLNSTLPLNSHYIDGFATGDTYQYPWANKRAAKTYTDYDFYFVDKGKIDIFNFSKSPGGTDSDILKEFIIGNKFKFLINDLMPESDFIPLNTNVSEGFAYARYNSYQTIIVVGNLDFTDSKKIKISLPKLKEKQPCSIIKAINSPEILNGKIISNLNAGEVQILLLNNFTIK